MGKNSYNLARQLQVNRGLSRLRIAAVLILGLTMVAFASWRLKTFMDQQGSLRGVDSTLRNRQALAKEGIEQAQVKVNAQQKIWKDKIDWANALVMTTAPTLSLNLDRLESLLPERVRIEMLSFDRSKEGSLTLSVEAETNDDLFELYRRLVGFELVISSESSTPEGRYRASLAVVLPKESETERVKR